MSLPQGRVEATRARSGHDDLSVSGIVVDDITAIAALTCKALQGGLAIALRSKGRVQAPR